jgi:hypothetical protein
LAIGRHAKSVHLADRDHVVDSNEALCAGRYCRNGQSILILGCPCTCGQHQRCDAKDAYAPTVLARDLCAGLNCARRSCGEGRADHGLPHSLRERYHALVISIARKRPIGLAFVGSKPMSLSIPTTLVCGGCLSNRFCTLSETASPARAPLPLRSPKS